MKLPGEGCTLDLFLCKVSAIKWDTERERIRAKCNRNSGRNGSWGRKRQNHKMAGEDPGIVGLDGTGVPVGVVMTIDLSFIVLTL